MNTSTSESMIDNDALGGEKDIDKVIKQVANDANLYGLDADKVQEIWLAALLQQVADNELDKKSH